jgi:hypothetical protein
MTDPAAARRAFLLAQVENLEALGFVIVGIAEPLFDAIQVRREEDDSFIVEIAARDEATPFTAQQVDALEALAFASEADTWVGAPLGSAGDAVDAVEDVLAKVLTIAPDAAVDVRHGTLREERAAEAKVATMRAFIEPVLESITGQPAVRDADDDYMLELADMRVFVAPRAFPGRPPIIRVFAITNASLNLTPDLGLFLSRLNFSLAFGRFSIDADRRAVWFDETLLGDQVTADELAFVVRIVAETAGEWDEKIGSMFGGSYRGDGSAAPGDTASAKPGQGGYL